MQRADRLALRLRAHSPQARLQLLQRRQQDAGRQLRARMTRRKDVHVGSYAASMPRKVPRR
ncbi:hypothetical protein XarbCFBP7408_00305 [Xanthomonas arboricola pv. guizotiae]|uniref:Uncharacterized protein n=1 Tax=Xanthomonas arboricola pv. guizotiae TaxID=487867 RepID=A0A2S7A455_9XANT|nr:hypothetical protein XarbCFBP7409_07805 [Xanthomonas arboricola pv. guizotiae]PPU27420.1 hypothetical protein XarbCFBP7408_00305 [Xanthomonas arboricola pv. guizotiae]